MSVSQTYITQAHETNGVFSGSFIYYFTSSYIDEDQFTVDVTGSTLIANAGFSIEPIDDGFRGADPKNGAIIYLTSMVSASIPVTITRNNLPETASSLVIIENGGDQLTISDDGIFYNGSKDIDFFNNTVNMTASYSSLAETSSYIDGENVKDTAVTVISSSYTASMNDYFIVAHTDNNDVDLYLPNNLVNKDITLKHSGSTNLFNIYGKMDDYNSASLYNNQSISVKNFNNQWSIY